MGGQNGGEGQKSTKSLLRKILLSLDAVSWVASLGDEHKSELVSFSLMGHNCCTAVEHTPHNKEVMGSNPVWCWAFLLLLSFPTTSGVSLLRSLKLKEVQ